MRSTLSCLARFKTEVLDLTKCFVVRFHADVHDQEPQVQELAVEIHQKMVRHRTKVLALINSTPESVHAEKLFKFLVNTCQTWAELGVTVHVVGPPPRPVYEYFESARKGVIESVASEAVRYTG